MPAIGAPPVARRFVPADLDCADWSQGEPLYQELLGREVSSVTDLRRWLEDFAELDAAFDEFGSRRFIEHSCHTDDVEIKKHYLHWVEVIEPRIKPLYFELQQKLLASPFLAELEAQDRKYVLLARQWRADVEIFRPANVPLETEVTKLVTKYEELCGDMTVVINGEELTLQQAARFLEEPDRAVRQSAWEGREARRFKDREAVDALFDQVVKTRHQIATNAGLPSFTALIWKEYKRFDYTPEQCAQFADAIERTVVPLAAALDRQHQADMKLPALRPWDTLVDPHGRPPLRPYARDDTDALVSRSRTIFDHLSPALGEEFDSLRVNGDLDLASRKGKQPGGYQCSLEESRRPFIFMNAAGLHDDVVTLLHEGGHAFHMLAARDELLFTRNAPIEFCEVASMAMELLGADHFGAFYADPADVARAQRHQLQRAIRLLPWVATIDQFQHWLYANPGHTRDDRTAAWLSTWGRFAPPLDWTGLEAYRANWWQRQPHLFGSPLYYVEYGIAQLGALQLWVKSRHDTHRAIANYRAALKLGGTRPLPELFAAAGIVFDFSEKTLRPLMDAVGEELERLPR
ncbi:MAG: M3 family oligoendopeptidase [Phycisphaerae bacterium]|nr:M3 family oligoendopeptidase [Tepidisphaeraceae bacterium]